MVGAGCPRLSLRDALKRSDGLRTGGGAALRANVHCRFVREGAATVVAVVSGARGNLDSAAAAQCECAAQLFIGVLPGRESFRVVVHAMQSCADVFEAGDLAVAAEVCLRAAARRFVYRCGGLRNSGSGDGVRYGLAAGAKSSGWVRAVLRRGGTRADVDLADPYRDGRRAPNV